MRTTASNSTALPPSLVALTVTVFGVLPLLSVFDAGDVEDLGAVQLQRRRGFSRRELQRDDAHADQVGAVDALEGLGDHRAHTEQAGALGGPVP